MRAWSLHVLPLSQVKAQHYGFGVQIKTSACVPFNNPKVFVNRDLHAKQHPGLLGGQM